MADARVVRMRIVRVLGRACYGARGASAWAQGFTFEEHLEALALVNGLRGTTMGDVELHAHFKTDA